MTGKHPTRRGGVLALALGTALGCGADAGTTPTTDLVSAAEKAAVQEALSRALTGDSLYTILSTFVLPYVDQATPVANGPGDTTRLAGFQLDFELSQGPTALTFLFSGTLAWRGYRPASGTVDSVFLVFGDGAEAPVADSLRPVFIPGTAGTGSGWVVAQATDSSVSTWLARSGLLTVSGASYDAGTSFPQGGLTLTRSRGSLAGGFDVTAKLVPDSATTVTAGAGYPGGIHAVQLRFVGGF